ncbi:endonuclease/exonuclease/phosphatase family protein [uncultured Lamprocystis sp.]|uniref:endonuclease/exonuclease/phosphatase family protein n=1 Tax=uncultured Lamprocystis sp. TaxID=543132 RepID=UPI0025EC6E2D|nr:endonuclease/exonuclease/phosphatase family protein [uncultured Lamprocystis sp.]
MPIHHHWRNTTEVPVQRGFVAINARVAGKNYRIVNTHLEVREPQPGNPISQVFQAAQAFELIGVLRATTPIGKSLLVLGDFNSSPEDAGVPGPLPLPEPFDQGLVPPYQQLAAAGYTDGWTLRWHVRPGFTCCQAEDLLNENSQLYERIDLILSWPAPARVEDIRVVGTKHWDKTRPPAPRLWPSDHGAVAAELRF